MHRQKSVKHLYRRGEIFYLRLAVPASLHTILRRNEIKMSLRTSDRAFARRRCRTLTNLLEELFMAAAANPELTSSQLTDISRSFFRDMLIADNDLIFFIEDMWGNDPADREEVIRGTENSMNWMKAAEKDGNAGKVMSSAVARKLAQTGNTHITASSDSFNILSKYFLRAKIESNRVLRAKLQGDHAATVPHDPLFADIMDDTLPPLPGEGTPASTNPSAISVLVSKFKAAKSLKWSHKTIYDYNRVLGLFSEWFGELRSLETINSTDIGGYRDMLLKLPKMSVTKRKAGYETLSGCLENPNGIPVIHPKTAEKYLHMSRTFLIWCCDEGYIAKVPGSKIGIEYVDEEKARDPFSEAELRTLFSSSIWTGCFSESRRSRAGGKIFKNAHFWFPLIGAFTGLRSGEISQLKFKDIRIADGVPYFDINARHEKRLKTKYSNRRIPIHPTLQKIGFLDFLNEKVAKNGPESRVFSEIKITKSDDASHGYSKKFRDHLKAIGIKTPKNCFHSFRHTFSDACDNALINSPYRYAMMGHSDKSAANHYGVGAKITVLLGEISRIKYEFEVDLLARFASPGEKP